MGIQHVGAVHVVGERELPRAQAIEHLGAGGGQHCPAAAQRRDQPGSIAVGLLVLRQEQIADRRARRIVGDDLALQPLRIALQPGDQILMRADCPQFGVQPAVVGEDHRLGGQTPGLVFPDRAVGQTVAFGRAIFLRQPVVHQLDLQVHRRRDQQVGRDRPTLHLREVFAVQVLRLHFAVLHRGVRIEAREFGDDCAHVVGIGDRPDHHRRIDWRGPARGPV